MTDRLETLIACARCERGIRPYGAFADPDPLSDGLLCGDCIGPARAEHEERLRNLEAARRDDRRALEDALAQRDWLDKEIERLQAGLGGCAMTPYWTSHFGRHVLYHGDCREVLPALAPGTVDAVVTDPPYGIGKWSATGGNSISASQAEEIRKWDARPADSAFLKILTVIARTVVIWGGNYFDLGACRAPLVWDKGQRGMHFADGEMAWTNFSWGTLRILQYRIVGGETFGNKLHPTQKPVPVMEWSIKQTKEAPGSVILDPYAGSGTTGVACIRTGRRFIGVERSREYCDIAVRRMEAELAQPMLIAPETTTETQGELL